ncbi:MAG: hypothetical protein JJU18_13095 [Oceanicaulis sp.]|nr:hypothetical protein [Oceanicaulis sp.]
MTEREDNPRFQALYGAQAAAGDPGFSAPAAPRPGSGAVDLLAGLVARFALAAQFWTWWRANALPLGDPADWRAWIAPDPGLVDAARLWTQNQIDPALAAAALLAAAGLLTISLTAGLLARLAGLTVVAGAVWHMIFILPDAWPSTLAWGALGVYLALRGAGPASLDWMIARLARLG